ncbi:DUF2243 domain-containing protein [Limimaricola litoreus]|uniref:DUF2243 domain-containing protein n=1 Tax=Limimaricola litoreus TaxID=2955316 RepID=A0A9X2FMA7_9RHOB|nr:DUF2243 domain-containing protein [Limimaricola litoreus]MCP1167194.1 DUF2243 domain-containing protein [Limimaricola litoreus]
MRGLSWSWHGLTLGIGLGGFFDGILLHQILQWHHLLSLVPGVDDLRAQVLWDGYFHLLMYVLAAIGLWGLWRSHVAGARIGGRALLGVLIAGFGTWHILDSVLSHWLLGIHRIRIDSAYPLLWDLLWFAVFGLLPLAIGWALWRRGGGGGGMGLQRSSAALLMITLVSLGAGGWSLRPPPDQPFTTVVFRPGHEAAQIEAALSKLSARLVWADPGMSVVVVDVPADRRWSFYRHGALLVSGTGMPSGCFNWSTA